MTDKVLACAQQLTELVQSIAEFGPKVLLADTPEQVIEMFKAVPAPCCGVVYEGRRSKIEDGQTRRGMSQTVVFGLYVVIDTQPVPVSSGQVVPVSIATMKKLEQAILGLRSPTGHPWNFLVEAYGGSKGVKTLWVQRWDTTLIAEPVVR